MLMQLSQFHYLPVSPTFFSILFVALLVLLVLIQIGILRHAYTRIGLGSRAAMLLLLGSLIGGYVNIPVAELPTQQIISGQEVTFFGVHYLVPVVVDWPGTVVAVNVGGAAIAGLMSLYLLIKSRLWGRGLAATACLTVVVHLLAQPVPGLGIAVPMFVPALVAAVTALLLSCQHAAPLAYIGGSLGTLIGADLLNLDKIPGLGAPVASIGGAGTFDGIFLTGVLAVLIANLSPGARRLNADQQPEATTAR